MNRTPFYQLHVDHGAKFVDFAGWEMPIMYRSIHEEHKHVRNSAGLFDVSHMGRIKFTGRQTRRFLERVLTRRISDMPELSCRYSLICNERGGVRDDVIVYRFADYWLLVVNASNREKILAHLKASVGDLAVKIEDQTTSTGMVALQGPKVMEVVGTMSREVPSLKRYHFCIKNLLIMKLIISRTGYTGEDGIEIIMPGNMAAMAMKLWLREGPGDQEAVLQPAGLGARDSLRLEAGMPLYGHELSEDIDPISAGLAFAVSLDKDQMPAGAGSEGEPFIGQEALKKIAAAGPVRRLVGLRLDGKRTPRQGMKVLQGDQTVGEVTSGCLSPTLGYPIAMAYVDSQAHPDGILLGEQKTPAQETPLPFYKRPQ
ncbi:MAG: glycine cleavage system aminomethyltransferase GcvT [Phycisphaeraceae bacterium]|nr:glycine cleavage system aminomethyltransferase GcvT [Phycisphaeraceae bacterium]